MDLLDARYISNLEQKVGELEAENERLRTALQPFAARWETLNQPGGLWKGEGFSADQFEAAAKALEGNQ